MTWTADTMFPAQYRRGLFRVVRRAPVSFRPPAPTAPALILLLSVSTLFTAPFCRAKSLQIIFTADGHGNAPLARLYTLVRQIRRTGPALLLSAGGEIAGGPYDRRESDRTVDDLRTRLVLRTFEALKYDAYGLGDEEFAMTAAEFNRWKGRIPFLSANVELPGRQAAFKAWSIIDRSDVRVALVGLTTRDLAVNEFGRRLVPGLEITDPVETALEIVKCLRGKADIFIFLAHIGERLCRRLAGRLPVRSIILCAHRRMAPDIGYRINKSYILLFDYETSHLLTLRVELDESGMRTTVEAIPIDRRVKADPATAASMKAIADLASGTVRLDYYRQADCPLCHGLDQLIPKLADSPTINLLVRTFTLSEQPGGGATPGQGSPDARAQNDKSVRGESPADWRARALGVDRSPALFIDNSPYTGEPSEEAIKKAVVAKAKAKSQSLRPGSPPAHRAWLIYHSDFQRVDFKAVEAGFNLSLRLVPENSETGARLVKKARVTAFPAVVTSEPPPPPLAGFFLARGALFLLDPAVFGPTVYPLRHLKQRRIDIIASPTQHKGMLGVMLDFLKDALENGDARLSVHPVLGMTENGRVESPYGLADREEGDRILAAQACFRPQSFAYMQHRLAHADSTYWDLSALAAGISPAELRKKATSDDIVAYEKKSIELLGALGNRAPAVLVHNRFVLLPLNASDARFLFFRFGLLGGEVKKQ